MKKTILAHLCLALLSTALFGNNEIQPTKENLAVREWFQDAKFGLFIHWGVYSILADGEWVMQRRPVSKASYEKLPAFFNPTEFNPAEWVAMAKAAGMKYITITSKHHDGFAMFDSKLTGWDIVDRTPYKKDVLKALADACQKQGIKLFFYYSQLDWYHNDYYPRGRTGQYTGRPDQGNWQKYVEFMNGQLTELLTNYGEIGGIWFDGWWDNPEADWHLQKTYNLIHQLQPAALIGNNHHKAPKPGEDFQMFEKDLPGQNTTGYRGDSEISQLPLETCETMNNSWGFNITDTRYKSSRALIQYLVRAAGSNANFLLNVGPMPNGNIQPEFIDTLKVIGNWMEKNGETIYGTRGGPVQPREWGVTTQKGTTVYVHVLDRKDDVIFLPGLRENIATVKQFNTGKKLNYTVDKYGMVLALPDSPMELTDLIIEIQLE